MAVTFLSVLSTTWCWLLSRIVTEESASGKQTIIMYIMQPVSQKPSFSFMSQECYWKRSNKRVVFLFFRCPSTVSSLFVVLSWLVFHISNKIAVSIFFLNFSFFLSVLSCCDARRRQNHNQMMLTSLSKFLLLVYPLPSKHIL